MGVHWWGQVTQRWKDTIGCPGLESEVAGWKLPVVDLGNRTGVVWKSSACFWLLSPLSHPWACLCAHAYVHWDNFPVNVQKCQRKVPTLGAHVHGSTVESPPPQNSSQWAASEHLICLNVNPITHIPFGWFVRGEMVTPQVCQLYVLTVASKVSLNTFARGPGRCLRVDRYLTSFQQCQLDIQVQFLEHMYKGKQRTDITRLSSDRHTDMWFGTPPSLIMKKRWKISKKGVPVCTANNSMWEVFSVLSPPPSVSKLLTTWQSHEELEVTSWFWLSVVAELQLQTSSLLIQALRTWLIFLHPCPFCSLPLCDVHVSVAFTKLFLSG